MVSFFLFFCIEGNKYIDDNVEMQIVIEFTYFRKGELKEIPKTRIFNYVSKVNTKITSLDCLHHPSVLSPFL